MTRARDYQILALTGKPPLWLNELRDDAGQPLVRPAAQFVEVGAERFAARGPANVAASSAATVSVDHGRPARATVPEHPPLRLRPSAAVYQGSIHLGERQRLGDRLVLAGNPDMSAIGEACHRFFASDHEGDSDKRLKRAERLLQRWSAPELAPNDLVIAGDRLKSFVAERFGASRALREWPVHALAGPQVIAGKVDLLLDDGESFVIFDHKSFPGTIEVEDDRLRAFAGQARLYAQALETATGRKCREFWLHQPILAVMSRVTLEEP